MHLVSVLRPSSAGHSTLSFRRVFPMGGQKKLVMLVMSVVQNVLAERGCVFFECKNEKIFS